MERKMAHAEYSSRKDISDVSAKGDGIIIAGYLVLVVLALSIYYLANSPGTAMSDFAAMSVFP
jgi:hypothetical protein